MVKLWIFVDFLVKKKMDLDDVYFGLSLSTFVGNERETIIAKLPWVCYSIPAQVCRVKIYKSIPFVCLICVIIALYSGHIIITY